MKILIASRNAHKIQEIREIFDLPGVEWVSTAEFPDLHDVVEDGDTFEANAVKKATELACATGLWALADESGLEVTALGNAPGVWSARSAGEPCNHANNNATLLRELAGKTDRSARFRCVAALSDPTGRAETGSKWPCAASDGAIPLHCKRLAPALRSKAAITASFSSSRRLQVA